MAYDKYPAVDGSTLLFPPSVRAANSGTPMTTTQRNALAGAELWNGRLIYNTTLSRYQKYNGSTWITIAEADPFTSNTPGKTGFTVSSEQSYWWQDGKRVIWHYNAVINAAVSATMVLNAPVNFARAPVGIGVYGKVTAFDTSAGFYYQGSVLYNAAGSVKFASHGAGLFAAAVPFTWANTDTIGFTIEYESV
jgi:hypothetical protein